MANDKLNYLIELEAKKNAKNKDYYLPIIQGRIFNYIKQYIKFINDNTKKLKEYISIEDENFFFDQEKDFSYKNLWTLLMFLKSGQNLVDSNYQIVESSFNKYKEFSSPAEFEKWKDFLLYAEKKLGLKGIKKLHDYLQFVIALYKVEEIRTEYCKEILNNMWKEKEKIFEEKTIKQEKIFDSNILVQEQSGQYNYLQ